MVGTAAFSTAACRTALFLPATTHSNTIPSQPRFTPRFTICFDRCYDARSTSFVDKRGCVQTCIFPMHSCNSCTFCTFVHVVPNCTLASFCVTHLSPPPRPLSIYCSASLPLCLLSVFLPLSLAITTRPWPCSSPGIGRMTRRTHPLRRRGRKGSRPLTVAAAAAAVGEAFFRPIGAQAWHKV